MKSDKEFFNLFYSCPEMLFEITGIKTSKSYTMKSITLKEFELRMDGFLETDKIVDPVFFVEFQANTDNTIYQRLVKGMAAYSEKNPKRQINGMIIFTKESLDPKTKPWYLLAKVKNSGFRVLYFDDILKAIEDINPNHPLVLVFKPFLIDDEVILKEQSKEWYSKLNKANLPDKTKETFCSVFVNWLMERFKDYSYKEILAMVESLTPLEETRAYKELVAKGKEEGKIEGKIEITKKMLQKGSDIHFIAEVTELSIEEIEKIKKEL
jgi:predicted transposase YdaD